MTWQGHTAFATLAITLAAAAPAAGAAEPLPLRPPGLAGPLKDERLSDEKSITRFALPNRRVTVRTAPRENARAITKLHWYTEDFYPEIYVVLEARSTPRGPWVRVRVPGRPNGRTGWVPRWGLRPFRIVRTRLEIDKRRLTAKLYDRGRVVWRSRVGIGAPGTPTPSGRFWIRERAHFGSAGGPYGPIAFGTSAYSVLSDWPGGGVVGIHGTNAPSLIPGRPSHGCIRVKNGKILALARRLPLGTPVIIS